MRSVFILLGLLFWMKGSGQELSVSAEIRVVTCGPYQGELYSAFGHSAFRVLDPESGMDYIYNYGVFNFNQPNFYLNFARGYLLYKLDVQNYNSFVQSYIYEDRYVHEQVLNLSPQQKQQLFDFLQWNALPENAEYYYDYFYNNCATRIYDVVKRVLGALVRFHHDHIQTDHSIRDLTDMYLQQQPWGDLGIDICLGLPIDKRASPEEYLFLPDYIEAAFDNATIMHNGENHSLVKEKIITHSVQHINSEPERGMSPFYASLIVLFTGILWTFLSRRWRRGQFIFDAVLFTLTGLVGWLLLLLWIATDHGAAAYNMNILWAIPFYFPMGLLLLFFRGKFIKFFFLCTTALSILCLIFWIWLPQDLPDSIIPIVILLALRGWIIYSRLKSGVR